MYGSDLAKSSSKIINNGALSLSGNSATVYEVENNGALYVTRGATYDLGKITGSGSVTITGGTFSTKPAARLDCALVQGHGERRPRSLQGQQNDYAKVLQRA